MGKGQQTRETIVGTALEVASVVGLDGLSIGDLAGRLGLSKSGLFAHFGSKEGLQRAVLDAAVERFAAAVARPAFERPAGHSCLEALAANWIAWIEESGLPGGCPLLSAMVEFDDRPGPIRDMLAHQQGHWRDTLAEAARLAVRQGHLRPDTDVDRLAFELLAIGYGYAVQQRLTGDPAQGATVRAVIADILARVRVDDVAGRIQRDGPCRQS
jgi:AcrR family transcriptional regulator